MVFCSQCGVQGQGRFCSQCGAPLNTTYVPAGSDSAPPPPYQLQQPPPPPPPPQAVSTALIDPKGQVTPAFYHLASELFTKLDQSVDPKGTRVIEPSKMAALRRMSGNTIPQYFESHVLPVFYKHLGAQCVLGTPKPNILTWDGWHTFLYHKIVVSPSETYRHFLAAIHMLGIQLPQPLSRGDLPLHPFPEAVTRQQNFQNEIQGLARAATGMQFARTAAVTGLMRQAGMGAVNAVGGGGGFYRRRW